MPSSIVISSIIVSMLPAITGEIQYIILPETSHKKNTVKTVKTEQNKQNRSIAQKNERVAMCIVIWVNKDQFEEERTRVEGNRRKFRDIWQRLTTKSASRRDHMPPAYAELGSGPNHQVRPTVLRRRSFTPSVEEVDTCLAESIEGVALL
ncbi:hypothetical protein V490_00096 [Pseudogymnoascus sp. VKM F-3557]|nr:hypothetical protein V490_00096 [Pseudogymnoascus sp. VKM F-3557]